VCEGRKDLTDSYETEAHVEGTYLLPSYAAFDRDSHASIESKKRMNRAPSLNVLTVELRCS
jgi:hypothetical protein